MTEIRVGDEALLDGQAYLVEAIEYDPEYKRDRALISDKAGGEKWVDLAQLERVTEARGDLA